MVKLTSPRGELVLAPERGGSVSTFKWDGNDVLRPFIQSPGPTAPATEFAAFPLIPFSGRIADGKFEFDGRSYALPPNFPPEPHAIHGQGWQAPWEVIKKSRNTTTLNYCHDGSNWPWRYTAEQTFSLVAHGLSLVLTLTNEGESAMPAGIGWHPYFPARGAILTSDVTSVWLSGDDMIPGAPSELTKDSDLTVPRNVSGLRLDNAFRIGGEGTRITWPDRSLSLTLSATEVMRHLIVYTPEGEDYFCVEPVSHAPDAVNSSEPASVTGLQILEPGASLSGVITLTIE